MIYSNFKKKRPRKNILWQVVKVSFVMFFFSVQSLSNENKSNLLHDHISLFYELQCPHQPNLIKSGYYMLRCMWEIVWRRSIIIPKIVRLSNSVTTTIVLNYVILINEFFFTIAVVW